MTSHQRNQAEQKLYSLISNMTIRPKKSLGQHFLNSRHVLEQIISAANIIAGESILEIGPGTGFLTEALLNSGAKVIAVEKDDRSISLLNEKFSREITAGRLTLIHGDILEPAILAQSKSDRPTELSSSDLQSFGANLQSSIFNRPYAIVANIPYYITGAILEKFLEHGPRPNRMVLLVQKEVAKRILGSLPGGEGIESVLSISVKAFGIPKIEAFVPRGAFTPPPTVDSAILVIEHISADRFADKGASPEGENIKIFFSVVKTGFAHKRKYAIRNLEAALNPDVLSDIWRVIGLEPHVRPEMISVDQWIDIAATDRASKKAGD